MAKKYICDLCGGDATRLDVELLVDKLLEGRDPQWVLDFCDGCYDRVARAIGDALVISEEVM